MSHSAVPLDRPTRPSHSTVPLDPPQSTVPLDRFIPYYTILYYTILPLRLISLDAQILNRGFQNLFPIGSKYSSLPWTRVDRPTGPNSQWRAIAPDPDSVTRKHVLCMKYADNEPHTDFEPPSMVRCSCRHALVCDFFFLPTTCFFLCFMPYVDPFLLTKFRLGLEVHAIRVPTWHLVSRKGQSTA